MSVIALFSGSYCHEEEIVSFITEKLNYSKFGDELIDITSEKRKVTKEQLLKAITTQPSLFGQNAKEKSLLIAYLKEEVAIQLEPGNIICSGWMTHLIPKEITHVLKVCLIAPDGYRIDGAADTSGLSKRECVKIIEQDNNDRFSWCQYLFNTSPWDKSLYDIKVPIHETSAKQAAELILGHAQGDALKISSASEHALKDFRIASAVEIAVLQNGYQAEVACKHGHVELLTEKPLFGAAGFQEKLSTVVEKMKNVRSVKVNFKIKETENAINPFYNIKAEATSKILLVDDEKDFIQTLSERLSLRDLGSAVAFNGEEALTQIKSDEPDVMVLDLKMPGIGGLEVLRQVKQDHPNIEVIILTGHGSAEDEKTAFELGAFAYLLKPADIDKIAKTINAAYEKIRKVKNGID